MHISLAGSFETVASMSMVLATTWVRRGVAAQFPTKYDIDEAELGRISKLARLQLEDAQNDLNVAQGPGDAGTPRGGSLVPRRLPA